MSDTWIKLYRKSMEHDVFDDEPAWRVWTWILMSVDYETGEMTFGRFKTSEALKISPSKFRHIIDRLRGKYELIETTNNHSHTKLKVRNWSKYQAHPDSIVDNLETGPDVRPQTRPQANSETRPQEKVVNIPEQSHEQNIYESPRPQTRPQGEMYLGPQVTATNKATNQEYKKDKEIKNNYPKGELQLFENDVPEEEKPSYIAYPPPLDNDYPEPLVGEVVKIDKDGKPVKSFTKVDVGDGMGLLAELLGNKVPKHNLNVYALLRLYADQGKEKTLGMLRYSFRVHDDRYAPKIYNFLDLEEKWPKIAKYREKNGYSDAVSNTSVSSLTYDNVAGGVAW